LENAAGDYVVFFDSDDLMLDDFIKSRLNFLQQNPFFSFVTSWVQKINDLLYDEVYQEVVAATVRRYVNKGYRVLVLANRTEFLKNCHKFYNGNSVTVTAETTKEERDDIKIAINEGSLDAIFGSIKIFSEGISINGLSCLILPEPYNNEVLLEQISGRIMRKHPDKLDPVIVDFNFSGPSEKKQNNARLGFYLNKGWEVVQV
jgi:superfamily II DNA or RNA helicase